MIQRYSPDSVYHVRTGTVTNVDLVPDVDGEAVLFEDHIAAITPLVRALRDIRMSNAGTEQRKRGWNAAYELLERPEYKEIA
jgi:hypothetical protein